MVVYIVFLRHILMSLVIPLELVMSAGVEQKKDSVTVAVIIGVFIFRVNY